MTQIPTIQDIYNALISNLETAYGITIPAGNRFLEAQTGVLAQQFYLNYLANADVQKNIWPDTADSIANGGTLERFGNIILGRYPDAAVPGQYTATVTGSIGAVIPGTTVFKADSNSNSPGALYQIVGGSFTLTNTTDTISVIALKGGTEFGMLVGNTLTSVSPIANVDSLITIATVVDDPIDAEDLEEYRTKIIEKIQLTPGSWSAVDYRLIGLNVTGVQQTYAYANSGQSAVVDVYLQGNTPVANPGPSVSPSVLTDYQTALEAVLPLSVWAVNYNSCPINDVTIQIAMGSFPAIPAAQQTTIKSALVAFINGITPFIAAADVVAERNDTIATYNLTKVITEAAPGYGFSAVTFTVAGTPQTSWQADQGNISFLDAANVTFV